MGYEGEREVWLGKDNDVPITATEVALAKALWVVVKANLETKGFVWTDDAEPAQALRAFTEKIESL